MKATVPHCSSRWSLLESVKSFLPYFPHVNNQFLLLTYLRSQKEELMPRNEERERFCPQGDASDSHMKRNSFSSQ